MVYLLLTLLPVAAMSGWFMSSRQEQRHQHKRGKFPRDYIVGLNYILNEEPDKAVDIFIKLLEVDSDTVETHLALGSLFRRRGEVDRAIRIHQNLIARPQLDRQQRAEALLALGQDYMSAGVLDRAEHLLLEVIELKGSQTNESLRLLLQIYEQEKSWDHAIAIAEKMAGNAMRVNIAHYHCEKAQRAWSHGERESAMRLVYKALNKDPACVRASILLGNMYSECGNYKAALPHYQRVADQDLAFLSEVIEPMVACYQHLGKEQELLTCLHNISNRQPSTTVILALAERCELHQGSVKASEFLAKELQHRPTLKGLQRLIDFQQDMATASERSNLFMLRELVKNLLEKKPIYRCSRCGFSGKTLHWLCPSCHKWSAIKPISGTEGD